jgi:hypothetical protein
VLAAIGLAIVVANANSGSSPVVLTGDLKALVTQSDLTETEYNELLQEVALLQGRITLALQTT